MTEPTSPAPDPADLDPAEAELLAAVQAIHERTYPVISADGSVEVVANGALRLASVTVIERYDVAPPRLTKALNEAYKYQRPSSFSRGMRLDIKGITILMISGTASVGENGETVHPGDFGAQTKRAFQNVTELLKSEGATWKDVVRTTCYLRDIERDYEQFNLIRTEFFKPEKGRYLHPVANRAITHREAARLQSFPDAFEFDGTKTEIARQIGNAVPPLLAKAIALHVHEQIERVESAELG